MTLRRFFASLAAVAICLTGAGYAQAPYVETAAPEAIIMDFETGQILFEKDARTPTAPSSMSKLMTIYMIFERLKEGRLSLDDRFEVSAEAWRRGGAASGSSTMFLEPGTEVRVEDLLRGVIVQSGNDAAIALAEGVAGTEEAFAELMQIKAEEIGLTGSTFRNATGWPDPNHRMTLLDLARLSRRLIAEFPTLYRMFEEREFTWNGIRQANRNPLLGRGAGVDGLKTGRTDEAGYGLAASATRGGDRLIVIVNGLQSDAARESETARLLELGFEAFAPVTLIEAGEEATRIEVWKGENASAPVVAAETVRLILHRSAVDDVRARFIHQAPVPAPLVKGRPVGDILIEVPGRDAIRVPALAGSTVKGLGPLGVIGLALDALIFGGPADAAAAGRSAGR